MKDELVDHLPPIEIRPEVTVLSVLKHLNYKAWFAIAEFIDNSLQSSIAHINELKQLDGEEYKLIVDIQIETTAPGHIVITDNAAGIRGEDFPRAFRAAKVPIDRTGLSEFGMGMKSAACWFAENWNVRTKAIGEDLERTIHFNVNHIVENNIESLRTEIRGVDSKSHYTVVSLQNLHHLPQGRTFGKIKEHLASIYRVFIRDGRLELRVNNEPLSYQSPAILNSLPYISPGIADPQAEATPIEWRKDINLDFGNGQKVTGFAALRETGSTTLAGFALFRRDRLILGSHDDTYRPAYIFKQTNSYQYQRLFGELHVEGFEVSHTKDGFRWEEYEDIFLEFLKTALEEKPLDLLAQAENYRALPSKKTIEAIAIAATDSVAEHIEKDFAPLITDARSHPPEPDKLPTELDKNPLQASEHTVSIDDGEYTWIITLRTSIDPAKNEWVSLGKMENHNDDNQHTRRLSLDLSLAHPFSTKFIGANNENVELLLNMASAICISLVLSEDMTGEPPQSVLYHLNNLLRGTLDRVSIAYDNVH